jgi:regulator of protease activity HflC (stomatin/prohibitin superfamily)
MFGIRFIKFMPSDYVIRYKNGKITGEGVGISFYCYAPKTSVVVVPIASSEAPFIFEEVTGDYQTVTVQGQITYRIVDYKKMAQLLNYSIDLNTKKYISEDPKKLSQRIINNCKVLTKKRIENMSIKEAIRSCEALATNIATEIVQTEEINKLGIEIMGVSILAIQPTKETARALEAQAREEILRKADDALYERRNASIEQERKVKENELNTEIAVENKKKQIRESQLDTERLIMQKQSQIKDETLSYETALEEKRKSLIDLKVVNSKSEADAKAYELSAVMKSLEGINPGVLQSLANIGMQPSKLIAIAFQELAEKAEKIGHLNITPDLLQGLLKDADE